MKLHNSDVELRAKQSRPARALWIEMLNCYFKYECNLVEAREGLVD